MDHIEIERRWILTNINDIIYNTGELLSSKRIKQYYTYDSRYRKVYCNFPCSNIDYNGFYIKTKKEKTVDNNGYEFTIEHSERITKKDFDLNMPHSIKVSYLDKNRLVIPAKSNTGFILLEIDIFRNAAFRNIFNNRSLAILEIEFDSIDSANNFDGVLSINETIYNLNEKIHDKEAYELKNGELSNRTIFTNLNCYDNNDWLKEKLKEFGLINNTTNTIDDKEHCFDKMMTSILEEDFKKRE